MHARDEHWSCEISEIYVTLNNFEIINLDYKDYIFNFIDKLKKDIHFNQQNSTGTKGQTERGRHFK